MDIETWQTSSLKLCHVIDTILLDGAMFLTTSHARYKKKARGLRAAGPPIAIPMYMGITSAERIHMSSVYLVAGRMMLEASWRGFKKRGALSHPIADRMPVSCVLKNSTLRLRDGFGKLKTCPLM